MLLNVVCDGKRSDAATISTSITAPGLVLTLVSQPSLTVVEGIALAAAPVVRVQRNVSGVGLVPVAGVVVLAYPYMQAGVRTQTLMTPRVAKELNILGQTPAAVLANLGSSKLLFNFSSAPTDATGTAAWTNLGFIRHGPAGLYTITFACAGFFLSVETAPINVTTSVASVALRQNATLGALNITVCLVGCKYGGSGRAFGSSMYADGADGVPESTAANLSLPVGLSSYIAHPPELAVFDSLGRPLAGKAAYPAVLHAATGAAASSVVVREYPGVGSTMSALTAYAMSADAAADEGASTLGRLMSVQFPFRQLMGLAAASKVAGSMAFLPHNIGIGACLANHATPFTVSLSVVSHYRR